MQCQPSVELRNYLGKDLMEIRIPADIQCKRTLDNVIESTTTSCPAIRGDMALIHTFLKLGKEVICFGTIDYDSKRGG